MAVPRNAFVTLLDGYELPVSLLQFLYYVLILLVADELHVDYPVWVKSTRKMELFSQDFTEEYIHGNDANRMPGLPDRMMRDASELNADNAIFKMQ